MATAEHNLSFEQKELVALGASVGAGFHPRADHHLRAGAKGLDGEQLLAAVTGAQRVTAEAAVLMDDHVRGKLGPTVTNPRCCHASRRRSQRSAPPSAPTT